MLTNPWKEKEREREEEGGDEDDDGVMGLTADVYEALAMTQALYVQHLI